MYDEGMELMTERQWKVWDVMKRLKARSLTTEEAARILDLSARHVRRVRRDVEKRGKAALVHGSRGRQASNRTASSVRDQIVALRQGRYDGFNDTHFTEKLREDEHLEVSRATVQRLLRGAKVAAARPRRPSKHRRRRDRRAQAGLMALWDGSRHDWLEGRGPMLCLMGAIDDATGELLPGAHFVEQECAAGYLRVLRDIGRHKGLPHSLYMDGHGSLFRNDGYWTLAEELRGEQDPTHVGRALRALEVEVIRALSPQAKGRVERLWGTLQDRLCSELRLAQARTHEQANEVLERYRSRFNARFTVEPREAASAWRAVRRGVDLDRLCAFYYEAGVGNDNAVRLQGVVLDIPPGPGGRSYARARVEVRQLLDGSWRVYHGDQLVAQQAPTTLAELRAGRVRKRSAESRAFRKGVGTISPSLP